MFSMTALQLAAEIRQRRLGGKKWPGLFWRELKNTAVKAA